MAKQNYRLYELEFSSATLQPYGDGYRGRYAYKCPDGSWKSLTKVLKTATGKTDISEKQANTLLNAWIKEIAEKRVQELKEDEQAALKAAEDAKRAAEAEAMRAAKEAAQAEQDKIPYLGDYLNNFIELRAAGELDDYDEIERSTAAEYRRLAKNYINPYLGSVKVTNLTRAMVDEWSIELKTKFSATTVKKALILLKSVMEYASSGDEPLITHNPIKTKHGNKGKKREKNPAKSRANTLDEFNRAKLRQYISLNPTSKQNVAYSLALRCGLRCGEICGLQWKNVNLKAKTIYIEQAIGHDPDHAEGEAATYLKGPKSDKGYRTITLPDDVAHALSERSKAIKTECMAAGIGGDISELYVCGEINGKPLHNHWISVSWHQLAIDIDLMGTNGKRPTLHDLRHTFATVKAHQGMTPYALTEIMGHSSIKTTERYYIGANDEAVRREMERTEAQENALMKKHINDGEVLPFAAGMEG